MNRLVLLIFILLVVQACTDDRTNQKEEVPFSTIVIGDQVWSFNLNLPGYGSICPPDCDKNGRLYTQKAAISIADSIPGWRLPTEKDWEQLEAHFKDPNIKNTQHYRAGAKKLKTIKGFDLFPGFKSGQSAIQNTGTWAVYWVMEMPPTLTTQGDTLGRNRIIKTQGHKADMIYASHAKMDIEHYLSVKLIKE